MIIVNNRMRLHYLKPGRDRRTRAMVKAGMLMGFKPSYYKVKLKNGNYKRIAC